MGKSPLAFRRAGEAGSPADWEALSAESVITEASDLLVPGGCQPTISLGGGGLPAGAAAAGAATIRLIGPARVVLRPSENAAAEIEVVFGRAVVTGLAAGQPLRFTAAGLSGRVEAGNGIRLGRPFRRIASRFIAWRFSVCRRFPCRHLVRSGDLRRSRIPKGDRLGVSRARPPDPAGKESQGERTTQETDQQPRRQHRCPGLLRRRPRDRLDGFLRIGRLMGGMNRLVDGGPMFFVCRGGR